MDCDINRFNMAIQLKQNADIIKMLLESQLKPSSDKTQISQRGRHHLNIPTIREICQLLNGY